MNDSRKGHQEARGGFRPAYPVSGDSEAQQ